MIKLISAEAGTHGVKDVLPLDRIQMPIKISATQRKQQEVFFLHYFTLTACNIMEYSEVYIIEWVIPIENFGLVSLFMAAPLSISFKIYP